MYARWFEEDADGGRASDGQRLGVYKDVIYTPDMTIPEDAYVTTGTNLDVNWVKSPGEDSDGGGHVQVSVNVPRKNIEEWLKTDEGGYISWYSEPLSRYEINKMIKILRRARDSAYSPDE